MAGFPLSRRGLLASAVAVTTLPLTGCDLDPTAPSASAEPSPDPGADPDRTIVVAARAELTGLIERLGAGAATAALVATHRVQLAALQGDPPAVGTGPALAPARVRARERVAAARFTRWATSAQNGDLARVLASIAAGIRMQPVSRTPS